MRVTTSPSIPAALAGTDSYEAPPLLQHLPGSLTGPAKMPNRNKNPTTMKRLRNTVTKASIHRFSTLIRKKTSFVAFR